MLMHSPLHGFYLSDPWSFECWTKHHLRYSLTLKFILLNVLSCPCYYGLDNQPKKSGWQVVEWQIIHLLDLVIAHNQSTHEQNLRVINDIIPHHSLTMQFIEFVYCNNQFPNATDAQNMSNTMLLPPSTKPRIEYPPLLPPLIIITWIYGTLHRPSIDLFHELEIPQL